MNEQEVAKADYTVYQHIAPNGKGYIGITRQKKKRKRWKENSSPSSRQTIKITATT